MSGWAWRINERTAPLGYGELLAWTWMLWRLPPELIRRRFSDGWQVERCPTPVIGGL